MASLFWNTVYIPLWEQHRRRVIPARNGACSLMRNECNTNCGKVEWRQKVNCQCQPSSICTRITVCSLPTVDIGCFVARLAPRWNSWMMMMISAELYLHTRHSLQSARCRHQPSSICTSVTVCRLQTRPMHGPGRLRWPNWLDRAGLGINRVYG